MNLTDQQLNYKVAKLRGWKERDHSQWWHDDLGDGPPPDYANDLNAINEIEQASFTDVGQQAGYLEKLTKIVDWDKDVESWSEFAQFAWALRHATARQCAEAFVLVKTEERKEA